MYFRLGLVIIALCLTLVGCATRGDDSRGQEDRIARETLLNKDASRAINRADAETLYNTARRFLNNGDPTRALKIYGDLQARFPFSKYSTQAELESITANYRTSAFDAALADADRFVKQHPRNPNIDYVYYLRGIIEYNRTDNTIDSILASNGSRRDPTNLRQAFTDFNLLIQNYPDSIYNKDAQLHMIDIRNRLAKYELNVAEYYVTRRAWVASARRAQYVLNHYQGTDSIPRALEIIEQSYRTLGVEQQAQDAHTILMTSYPGYVLNRSEFYRQRAGFKPRYKLPPMDARPGTDHGNDVKDEPASKNNVSKR